MSRQLFEVEVSDFSVGVQASAAASFMMRAGEADPGLFIQPLQPSMRSARA
jgi:hypothetical protein